MWFEAFEVHAKLDDVVEQPLGVGRVSTVRFVYSGTTSIEPADFEPGGCEGAGRLGVPAGMALDAVKREDTAALWLGGWGDQTR